METTQVQLYTDEPLVEEGVRSIINAVADIELALVTVDAEKIALDAAASNPDVIVLDQTPQVHFGVISEIMKSAPRSKVILWVRSITAGMAGQSLELGVNGILRKQLRPELFLKCIRRVAEGELWFEQGIIQSMLKQPKAQLSHRESDLVRLLVQGLSNRQIGDRLGIKEGTVKVYLSKLYAKTGAVDRFDLALYGLKNIGALHQYIPESKRPVLAEIPTDEGVTDFTDRIVDFSLAQERKTRKRAKP